MATKGFFSRNRSRDQRIQRAVDKAANFTFSLPKDCRVIGFYINNLTANAVTGGIRAGSSDGGTQFLVAGAVAASGLYFHPAVSVPLLSDVAQTVYVQAVSAWNSAILDVKMAYEVVDRT